MKIAAPRTLISVATVATLAGALAACSPAGSSKTTNAQGASTTFVVARTGDVDKLDPQLATAFQTIETLGLVYSRLVTTDASGQLQPDLATKWDVSADGKTVTFTLRSGVKWADGDPFTADDVKASLNRILDQSTGAVARSNLTTIQSIDTTGTSTVTLHLSKPNAALLYALSSVNASILHTKDIQAGTIGKQPDGTGPFAWKSWSQGQQVVLTANSGYYGGAPKIKTLEFRVIPSESSILAGMRAKAFQMGLISDPGIAHQATGSGNFSLVKQPALAYHVLQLNGRHAPLTDQRVRDAIACAVDRNQVIQTAAYGDGQVTGPITSPAYQYSPTDGLPCTPGDLTAAKKLLAESGHASGFTLKTIVETGEYATSVAEGQNLQAQLAKIGVKLDLVQLTTAPYVQAWLKADFDAAVALNGGSSDPYLMYGRYWSTGGSLSIPAGLTSPKLAALLAQGNSTSDETTRHTVYGQLQQEMLAESPWVWLYRGDDYYLVGSSVQGFTPRADEALFSLASTSLGG